MKKSILFLCTAAALACGLSSCQKDQQQPGTLSATMEDLMDKESKVVYDGSAFAWQEGDPIAVSRYTSANTRKGTYTASLTTSPNKATFTYSSESNSYDVTNDETYQGNYYAIYPHDVIYNRFDYASNGSFTQARPKLPATYRTDSDGHLLGNPMFATSSTKRLTFKHICGLLRLQLQKENVSISSIKVSSASQALSGDFTVTLSGDVPSLQATGDVTDASKSVLLNLGSPTDLTTQKTFFIPLPAGDYTDLTIELTQPSGAKCEKTQQTGTFHIERSMYSTISLGENDLSFSDVLQGAIGGEFSISATKKVRFSQGNLQYKAGTWRFAEHQYDVCTDAANLAPSSTSTDWIDLFGWGTSGYNGAMPYNYLQGITYGPNDNITSGDNSNYDWGVYNDISNGGAAGQWRTLKANEWKYIYHDRTNAANLMAMAIVNGRKGLILLPDGWSPTGQPTYRGTSSNWTTNVNTYTIAQWKALEDQGAVFLPQNGYRTVTSGTSGVTSMSGQTTNEVGQYWSTTKGNSATTAYVFQFSGDCATAHTSTKMYKYQGRFVRLVHVMN